jgi:hypothetical protein
LGLTVVVAAARQHKVATTTITTTFTRIANAVITAEVTQFFVIRKYFKMR